MNSTEAHEYCFANKKMLENDKKCGCFRCCRIFSPKEIYDWSEDEPDWTAICPYCGVDSVIGESCGYPLTKESLEKMHWEWFAT